MDRRLFLLSLAAGTLAAVTACDPVDRARHTTSRSPVSPGERSADFTTLDPVPSTSSAATVPPMLTGDSASPSPSGALIPAAPQPAPPAPYTATPGRPPPQISSLPGTADTVALTIDDGVDSAVVGSYLDFITAADLRLTFFVNGLRPSWTEHAPRLRPLVESGQVQLANHTWSHPDITTLSDKQLASELTRNEQFLNSTYGVTAKPFLRPPYGYHNTRTDKLCAQLGLSSIVMWYGSFGDSAVLTQNQLLTLASQWLDARRVVIGHANHPTITTVYPQILELLRERHLNTVTLDDAFYGPAGRSRTSG